MSLMSIEAVDVSLMLLVTVKVVALVTLSPKSLPLYHQHKLTATIQCYPSVIDHAIEMMPLDHTDDGESWVIILSLGGKSLTILPPTRGEEKRLETRKERSSTSPRTALDHRFIC
jgi:hypothetical protein